MAIYKVHAYGRMYPATIKEVGTNNVYLEYTLKNGEAKVKIAKVHEFTSRALKQIAKDERCSRAFSDSICEELLLRKSLEVKYNADSIDILSFRRK